MMKTLAHPARNAGISLAVALAAMTPPLQAETLTVCAKGGCDYATIQAAIDAASNGDVIEVAAGTYLVDETIDTMGKAIALRGSVDFETGEPLTILDGQNARRVLHCLGGEGPDTIIEDLVIRNGYLSSDGGGMYVLGSSPTINNCTFTNNSAGDGGGFGGGLGLEQSASSITSCTFTENTASWGSGLAITESTASVSQCTFSENTAEVYGGAILNINSPSNLNDCLFFNNHAERGGGIYCYESTPSITNCSFTGNSSLYGGAGMVNYVSSPIIVGCEFSNNSCENYIGGGMLNWYDSFPSISQSIFRNNSSTGMASVEDSIPTITSTILCGNEKFQIYGPFSDNGNNCIAGTCTDLDEDGAPDCTSNDDLDLQVPEEYETIAEAVDAAADGAVITIGAGQYDTSGPLDLTGKSVTIRGAVDPKTAEPLTILDGQGTHMLFVMTGESDAPVRLENLVIQNGTRGLLLVDCTIEIANCRISGNSSENLSVSSGAGIYMSACTATMNDCTFENNSSGYDGGGLIARDGSSFQLERCTFNNNSATKKGGGFLNSNSTGAIIDCLFTRNRAFESIGGIVFDEETTIMSGTILCGNENGQLEGDYIDDGGNCVSNGCHDLDGDGLPECLESDESMLRVPDEYETIAMAIDAAKDGATILIAPGTYQPENVLELFGKNLTIRGDLDPLTGTPLTQIDGRDMRNLFLCREHQGPDTIFENLVIRNGYAKYGGGMQLAGARPTIRNCTFKDNRAEKYGGGLYHESGEATTLTECTFENNFAEIRGGGIHTENGGLTVTDSSFTGNAAESRGGGIATDGGWLNIEGSNFTANSSGYDGGAIDLQGSTALITECLFTGNHTDRSGGAIYNDSDDATLDDCIFTANLSRDGGAIMNNSGTVTTMNECVFSNNIAEEDGGGIHNYRNQATITNCTFTANASGDTGGGMWIESNGITVLTSSFIENESIQGGGMHITDSSLTIEACTFTGNTAIAGGGLFSELSILPMISNCTFNENTAQLWGGGIGTDGGSPVIVGCAFNGNMCQNKGGAIFNRENAPTIDDCMFIGNDSLYGPGVANERSDVSINNSTFKTNNGVIGGGVYSVEGSLALDGCTLTNNTGGAGGGIYQYLTPTTLTRTVICENFPDQIVGDYTDNGGNCISEECLDCDTCPGDLGGDGDVGGADLTILLNQWGCTGEDCTADLDGNGTVDGADLTIILSNWGACAN